MNFLKTNWLSNIEVSSADSREDVNRSEKKICQIIFMTSLLMRFTSSRGFFDPI